MNKKDIIIIALLVNAGLLTLLFMLAINTDDEPVSTVNESKEVTSNDAAVTHPFPVPNDAQHVQVIDEVDHFLNELSADKHEQSIVIEEEGLMDPEVTHGQSSNEEEPSKMPVVKGEEVKPVRPVVQPSTPSAQQTSQNPETTYVNVTVKRGDALEKIARNNGTTVEMIKSANGLTSTKLSIGQVLRVPVGNKSSIDANAPQPKKTPSGTSNSGIKTNDSAVVKKVVANVEPKYYTIKNGDTPWQLARQFNVKFEELLRLNDLDEEKARNLKVGDKIRVK